MKKQFYIFILGIFTLSINSCCTKEYCVPIINAPSIYFVFSGYDYYELDEVKYFRLNASNKLIIDSADNREYNNETLALIGYQSSYYKTDIENASEIKAYDYVIHTISRKDTIHNIDFTTSTYKKKCHSCFLANGKEEFTEIQNFSFYHNDVQHFDGDTIKINK